MKRWINKQTIISFILGALLFLTIPVFAESRTINAFYNNIRLRINGIFIETDVEPFVVNGRTMVPARFVAESLGASVRFNDDENCVDIESLPLEHGKITYSNGAIYTGEIEYGLPNGKGSIIWPDGVYCSATFVNGKKEGPALFCYPNGSMIVINFKEDKEHGEGMAILSEGYQFIMQYNNGNAQNISLVTGTTQLNNSSTPNITAPYTPSEPSLVKPSEDASGYQEEYDLLTAEYNRKIAEYNRAIKEYWNEYTKWASAYGEGEPAVQEKKKTYQEKEAYYNSLINSTRLKYNSDVAALKAKYGIND